MRAFKFLAAMAAIAGLSGCPAPVQTDMPTDGIPRDTPGAAPTRMEGCAAWPGRVPCTSRSATTPAGCPWSIRIAATSTPGPGSPGADRTMTGADSRSSSRLPARRTRARDASPRKPRTIAARRASPPGALGAAMPIRSGPTGRSSTRRSSSTRAEGGSLGAGSMAPCTSHNASYVRSRMLSRQVRWPRSSRPCPRPRNRSGWPAPAGRTRSAPTSP